MRGQLIANSASLLVTGQAARLRYLYTNLVIDLLVFQLSRHFGRVRTFVTIQNSCSDDCSFPQTGTFFMVSVECSSRDSDIRRFYRLSSSRYSTLKRSSSILVSSVWYSHLNGRFSEQRKQTRVYLNQCLSTLFQWWIAWKMGGKINGT